MRQRQPLKRKTPLRKKNLVDVVAKALDKPQKPMRKAKPGVAAAQNMQRRLLAMRSAGRCEAEWFDGCVWRPCVGRKGVVAAHIYQRAQCGKARDLLEVVIKTCVEHNADHLHDGRNKVRAPLRYAQAAWDAILAHSKLGVDAEDKLRSHIGSVGPRPERGEGIYQ